MARFEQLTLPSGEVVKYKSSDIFNTNYKSGAIYQVQGWLSTDDVKEPPTTTIRWDSKGEDETEDDADWDDPFSVSHYRDGELL